MATGVAITPEKLARYRATAQRRWEEEQAAIATRRQAALAVAERAAALLRARFSATRVVIFGSLIHPEGFTLTSDIDLAASGISSDDYFIAVAHLQDLSSEFQIDLVDLERGKPALLAVIEAEGNPL